jgi:hypothetical protein
LDRLLLPAFGGSVNPLLQPPYRLLLRGPVATGPLGWGRRIGPFSEIAHRLTSPMLRALLRFFTAKTSRTSAPFRVGYLRLTAALSAPLPGGLRFLRPLIPPTSSPFLTVGIPPRREAWGFPSWRPRSCGRGRLEPRTRWESRMPPRAGTSRGPTHFPFGLGVSACFRRSCLTGR